MSSDPFWDAEEEVFRINENTKIAHLLGEEIENPNITFHKVENICDERIGLLSNALYGLKKKSGNFSDDMMNLTNNINKNFEDIENSLYFKVKNLFNDFETQNEELNAKNLLLQKHLTKLTKEKMDILIQINLCMQQLDKIESFLGINIESKRTKKPGAKK